MSIYYKLYPKEKLFVEVMIGEITIDQLSAYFLELESKMRFRNAFYVYSDHQKAVFNFDEIQLRQLRRAFSELSKSYQFKRWSLIYEDDNQHMRQSMDVMSNFKRTQETEFIQFFKQNQLKESFKFLENRNAQKLFNQFFTNIPRS